MELFNSSLSKIQEVMLATVAATGVTRSSNLDYGHKPEGQFPSLSDPLGLLVFAALRPYGPTAHASRAACASPNQVNASPCSGPSSDAMNWQPVPRIEQGGQYASHGDPYAMQPGAPVPQVIGAGLSTEEQHFLSSCTTREYEEMARRKAEHMESAEHIAPQHNYPIPGKTSRYACTRMRPPARGRTLTAQLVPRHAAHACGGVTVYKNLSPAARAQHRIQCGRASTSGI